MYVKSHDKVGEMTPTLLERAKLPKDTVLSFYEVRCNNLELDIYNANNSTGSKTSIYRVYERQAVIPAIQHPKWRYHLLPDSCQRGTVSSFDGISVCLDIFISIVGRNRSTLKDDLRQCVNTLHRFTTE